MYSANRRIPDTVLSDVDIRRATPILYGARPRTVPPLRLSHHLEENMPRAQRYVHAFNALTHTDVMSDVVVGKADELRDLVGLISSFFLYILDLSITNVIFIK